MSLELKRRQISMLAGVVFGMGWIIFIDGIVHFNGCRDAVDKGDPCKWGDAPLNMTDILDVPGDEGDKNKPWAPWPDPSKIGPNDFNPWHHVETTPAPPPKHRGWRGLSGRFGLVYLPGFLAMISIFFVNTIDARHLTTEAGWSSGGTDIALQIWLFFGAVAGFSAITMAVWVHVDLFARHDDIKDGPGIAGIIQVLCFLISSLLFWIGRSVGVDSELSDPFL
mmetsp:Transcript_32079/g.75646  ORF Transcript_32079/g.75646 Transcript_32079/m.75646 type:complete len:223 (-) Transcript_32079:394-1062(-)